MTGNATVAVDVLNRQFLLDYPLEAIEQIEEIDPAVVGLYLADQSIPLVLSL